MAEETKQTEVAPVENKVSRLHTLRVNFRSNLY